MSFKKIKIINNQCGITLILTLIVMSLLLFLGTYFISFSLTDLKISRSHAQAEQGYYLAEAGLHETMYKLKNDDSYRIPFETDPSWSTTLTRANVFGANDSYAVNIQNTGQAHAELSASSSIALFSSEVQRVTQTNVFKALGQSAVQDSAGYADGNVDISFSVVNFYDGSAHSNNDFNINGASTVRVDKDLNAVRNYIKSQFSTVTITGAIHSANNQPAAEPITMPAVDFDSASPNSYKNQAIASGSYYTANDFETLLRNNQNLTLNNAVTYVEGDVQIHGNQNLTVNGLLVVGRDLIVGKDLCWWWGFLQGRCGASSITVNHAAGQPSGILAKRKIYFESFSGAMDLNGVVYANDQLSVTGIPLGLTFNAHGGLIGRKLTITSVWRPINLYHDNAILTEVLGATEFSPVINVEHWEEEY